MEEEIGDKGNVEAITRRKIREEGKEEKQRGIKDLGREQMSNFHGPENIILSFNITRAS